MIYYRTSNNNDATAEAMKVVFRKHLLAQAMPKSRKKYQKLNVKFLTQSGKTFLKVTVNS